MNPLFLCHVHIIESPSAADILADRREGILLSQGLQVIGIKSKYLLAVTKDTFWEALDKRIEYDNQQIGPPILHLSSHGNQHGIGLADGGRITWDELSAHLSPINRKLNGFLLVCISSCSGFQGHRMAWKSDDQSMPFFGIVGPTAEIRWDEAAIAFLTFYFQFLIKGKNVAEALRIMKEASGNTHFDKIKASDARQSWFTGMMGIINSIFEASIKKD